MNRFIKFQSFGFSLFLLVSSVYIVPSSQFRSLNQPDKQPLEEGQILYSPMWSTYTYLVDRDGYINNSWNSSYWPGVAVWWVGEGTILRTIRLSGAPGGGGGVQLVSRNGTVIWDFRYDTDGNLTHHDVKSLPNGDVLLIAWEHKTREEAISAGRNPDLVSNWGLSMDHIIEVKPTSPTSGQIVWEWHAWDHLIQDYDSSKENYGVVRDHPELININYWETDQGDMMHTNSIDYNPKLDQILISVCYYNEIWVIDHSTTTKEAAGHTGGTSGKGGDILYRWGNPLAYERGTSSDQRLFLQHDATWIKPNFPGAGDILVFNNEVNRHSYVDEITPPVNDTGDYYLEENSCYGPVETTWNYTAPGFYAGQYGGAIRLASGNTLITNGESGLVFEVNSKKETVWQYNTGVTLFKVVYVPLESPREPNVACSGSLSWDHIKPGATAKGSLQVQNIGVTGSLLNWTVDTSSVSWGNWSCTPKSGENLTPAEGPLTVEVSVVAPNESKSKFEGYLLVKNVNNPFDFEWIPVLLRTSQNTEMKGFRTFLDQLHPSLSLKHKILSHFIGRNSIIAKFTLTKLSENIKYDMIKEDAFLNIT